MSWTRRPATRMLIDERRVLPSKGYRLDDFRDPEAEIARLMHQAQVVQPAEHDALSALGFPREGIGLDVGCGPGGFASGLTNQHPRLKLVGLDIERKALQRGAGVMPVVLADACEIPFRGGIFDVAFARLALRYIDRPKQAIGHMLRVVRAGGLVLIEDADHRSLDVKPEVPGLQDVLAARHASMKRRGADPHVVLRTAGMLCDAGLETVTTRELSVTSAWIGVGAFAAIILRPIAEAVDDDLVGESELDALRAAIANWAGSTEATASTRVLFVAGRRPS